MSPAEPSLAGQPVSHALATLALGNLAEARAAALRLGGGDGEALHDMRVALRRLHSLLRAYPDELAGVVTPRQRRAVRRLARATNASRDAEVQLAWLKGQAGGLRPARRSGHDWLVARLERTNGVDASLARRVLKLHERLRPRLRQWAVEAAKGECYAAAVERRARRQSRALVRALAAVDGPHAVAAAHAARLEVKRLRYLLAPLRGADAACAAAVQRLRELQDLLGELHDRHLLAPLLAEGAADCAAARGVALFEQARRGERVVPSAWRPPEIPGLLWLAARNETALLALYTTLRERYLAGPEGAVAQPLAAACDALHAVSAHGFRLS